MSQTGGFTDPQPGGAAQTASAGAGGQEFSTTGVGDDAGGCSCSSGTSPVDAVLMGTRYSQEDLQTMAAVLSMFAWITLLYLEVKE